MKKLILITILFPMTAALAWDGIEPSSGTKIEITSRLSKVKKGNTVEIFDHGKNEYHEIEIDRISSHGGREIRGLRQGHRRRKGLHHGRRQKTGHGLIRSDPRAICLPKRKSRRLSASAISPATGTGKPLSGQSRGTAPHRPGTGKRCNPLPGCSKTAKIFIMWRTLVIPVSVRPAYPFFRHGQQNRSHSKGNHDHHYRHHHT